MMKSASPTTAPKTRRLPRGAFGPAGGVAAGAETLTARMPTTARAIPPARAGASRRRRGSRARVPATAGVVLVTVAERRPRPGSRGRAPRRACRRRPSSRRWQSRRRARGRRGGDPGAERLRPALDLVRELAEGADRPGGDLAAAHALAELDRLGALERDAGLVQKAEQEIVLRARRDLLHPAQDLLVSDRGGPLRERALLHDVVDPSQERVRRRLPLGEAIERLDAPDQLRVGGRQRGRLARERFGTPVRDRAEQRGRLVVEVVAGRDDAEAVIEGDTVHEVALGEAAARAGGPSRDVLDDGDRRGDLLGHGRHDQRPVAPPRERLALPPGLHGILEDAEVEVEARCPVPLVDQHVPERERVLAAGDGDEQVLVLLEHTVLPDRLADLVAEKVEKIRSAEGGVVAAELEYRRPAALPALHCRRAREAGPFGGWASPRCDPDPFLMPPLIPPGLARPARSVGGLRPGATRLRSSCRLSFHPGSRGRPARWVACDQVRPGSVPHAASHSTRAREAGPLGGWPATRCDPAPFLMPLLIPPGLARPARSVGCSPHS